MIMKTNTGYCIHCGSDMEKDAQRMCRDRDGDMCEFKARKVKLRAPTKVYCYADGTKAKIGDQVYGPVNNTRGVVAGTVVSFGKASSVVLVQFALVWEYRYGPGSPRMAVSFTEFPRLTMSRGIRAQGAGSDGPLNVVYVCCDYANTEKLTRVGP
jgi:hypothetical protein